MQGGIIKGTMKEKVIKNEYYNARWTISMLESLVGILLLAIFNIVEIFALFKVENFDSALIIFAFFDVIMIVAYYFGYRIPCVKFDINRKKPDEEEDITEKQKKYRNIINIVIVILMILGIVQTFASGSVVITR